MVIHPHTVYRKSSAGRDELKARSGVIDALARSVLILINGQDSLQEVQRKLGRDVAPPLQALVDKGLIELVAEPAPQPSSAPAPAPAPVALPALAIAPTPAAPPQAPGSAVQPAAPDAQQLAAWAAATRREIRVRLAPHFGADLMIVLEPLMKADTPMAIRAAMEALEKKLALYMGRKAAAQLFADLK